jgi:hypothetical protein
MRYSLLSGLSVNNHGWKLDGANARLRADFSDGYGE